tara:strand:+ start:214 stop:456 length:243 start_codon:yes stop_codon:yes gene_type:complete
MLIWLLHKQKQRANKMKIIKIAKGKYRTEKANARGEYLSVIKNYGDNVWVVVKEQEDVDNEFIMTADTKREAIEILKINY